MAEETKQIHANSESTTSELKRKLLIILGTISLCFGIIGIFIPILPTTPFLLLSAFCYAKSSKRLYNWLTTHRIFGKYIKNYLEKRGVPTKIKILAISFLWTLIGISIFFIIKDFWIRIILIAVAIGVSVHIIMIKTLRE